MEIRYDVEKFQATSKRVAEFLCQKTIYEKKFQDEKNQTYLGGIAFYIKGDRTKEGYITNAHLAFNSPPAVWNFKKIIEDIDVYERVMLINSGAAIQPY